jgi:hypothetical protein
VLSISYYKNVNFIIVYLSSTIPNATCHLLSTKVMFLFHNTTPGRYIYIKLHECFSIHNIVYAKYIQLNITFDPVHRYSYESPCEQGGTGRI